MRPCPSAVIQNFSIFTASFLKGVGQGGHQVEGTVIVNLLGQADNLGRSQAGSKALGWKGLPKRSRKIDAPLVTSNQFPIVHSAAYHPSLQITR